MRGTQHRHRSHATQQRQLVVIRSRNIQARDARVMTHHRAAIRRQTHIELNAVATVRQRKIKSSYGVFRGVASRATVADQDRCFWRLPGHKCELLFPELRRLSRVGYVAVSRDRSRGCEAYPEFPWRALPLLE